MFRKSIGPGGNNGVVKLIRPLKPGPCEDLGASPGLTQRTKDT